MSIRCLFTSSSRKVFMRYQSVVREVLLKRFQRIQILPTKVKVNVQGAGKVQCEGVNTPPPRVFT